MNDYAAAFDGHVRLAILQLLAGQAEYRGNDRVLTQAVQTMGMPCTGDQMRGHLSWLAEQRLVQVTEAGSLKVARLTERGNDVAKARSVVDGVARPEPGST